MKPQIEFKHVLSELSVNRNDPCEILRELISNSYDAGAKNLYYAPVRDRKGFIFLDDGTGLTRTKEKLNNISPWEAFFSIGKSTKKKGESIGYKCQGSKLCFACTRILVATKNTTTKGDWDCIIIDNPRANLDLSTNITPTSKSDICTEIDKFFSSPASTTAKATTYIKEIIQSGLKHGTLIIIDTLESEDFNKYFDMPDSPESSYAYNYIRFFTKHGDVRRLHSGQGFSGVQVKQVSSNINEANLYVFTGKKAISIPFGYPYLDYSKSVQGGAKSPMQISRLRDGRFSTRTAKKIQVGSEYYSLIFAIDGNRRALDDYPNLTRRGDKTQRSGIKLSDQRGVFISVKGIKTCRYNELLNSIDGYDLLMDAEISNHFVMIIDGEFDLVTNRNSITKTAQDKLSLSAFVKEIKTFLDSFLKSDKIFEELVSRVKKESSEQKLSEQIDQLESAKKDAKSRERFRLNDSSDRTHIFLSPLPGEEYLVGVLYSLLSKIRAPEVAIEQYWRHVITFSTQGIDSLGLRDEKNPNPLGPDNICSVEYKYEFNNNGPFNHALAIVDYIVAWNVNVDVKKPVKDTYSCTGIIQKCKGNTFEWEISSIESDDGGIYQNKITIIDLRKLIDASFDKVTFRQAS